MAERVRYVTHLVTRFFASLVPREPSAETVAHLRAVLPPPEFAVWERLSTADRAESVATLRRLPPAVAEDARWVAAALLHDAGKTASGLGTFGRVFATVRGAIRGAIGDPAPLGGRAGMYLQHAQLGAELLRDAGARPEVIEWARTHHEPAQWPVELIPASVCAALARADGELR